MGLNTQRESQVYLKVLADGTIREKVVEGTEGCVRREIEDQKTKEITVVFEMVHESIDGMIGEITLKEGKFGDQLMIPMVDGEESFNLALSISQNFGEDFMKKLPNIDKTKPVLINPFSFTSDAGKPVRGIDIRQDWNKGEPISKENGTKITSFYQEGSGRDTKNLHGYPEAEAGTKGDDWKIYFAVARKFLIKDLSEKGFIVPAGVAVDASAPVDPTAADDEDWDNLPKTEAAA